jgi:hypothetical protein
MLNPHGIDVDLIAGPSHSKGRTIFMKFSHSQVNPIENIESQPEIFSKSRSIRRTILQWAIVLLRNAVKKWICNVFKRL